jgi:hypothetical protein
MSLYGGTMIAVQNLEFCVSFLYLVGNRDPMHPQRAAWNANCAKAWLSSGIPSIKGPRQ